MGEGRTALLVGATGLIGASCLEYLLKSPAYTRVRVLARRASGVRGEEKLDERVIDFDKLGEVVADVTGDDVFICLGTTIKAVGGDRQRFYRVDHDYVVEVARLARQGGARRLLVVSSIGADAGSANFYLRTKGEMERDLGGLGYESVEIFRPSMLLGERKETRLGEAVGSVFVRGAQGLMLGPLRAYRPIEGRVVAAAMVAAAIRGDSGAHVRTFDEIRALAAGA
jgi:uncharacterized protein YbjT (DUF2867 family)